MKPSRSAKHSTESFPVVKVGKSGKVINLSEGPCVSSHPYPAEPGIYQLRPVARIYSAGPESGSWIPVYGWASGVLSSDEMPALFELPSLGLEPV